jgi:putative restriction endonuclease
VADSTDALRLAAFAHLDRLKRLHPDEALPSAEINAFSYNGKPLRLIVQAGIWKPAGMTSALSIRTTYTAPNELPPYEDDLGADGFVKYKYRGTDPQHSDNRSLREAMRTGTPLIYFIGVERSVYAAHYPVWIEAEDPVRMEFTVSVDPAQRALRHPDMTWQEREYALQLTKRRLHQPMFRTRVLRAYADSCAMCRLRHVRLLDAAHILRDGHPRGLPVVPNGLALCKIHHAAFDVNILGVRPDLVVEVRRDVLDEVDGPMLQHGLQEMHGVRVHVPRVAQARPDKEGLEERYEEFRAAG